MSEALRGHLAMLAFSAVVAGSFSLGSLIANEVAPIALMAVRFLLAAMVLAVAVHVRVGFRGHDALRAPWRYLVLGGLYAAYFVLMFEGLKTASPISTSALFTLTPLISGLFGYILMRQVMTRRMALALSIGAAGALWVIFRADLQALLHFDIGRGEMIFFVGMVSHAIYAPMVARLNRGEPALVFTFWALSGGFVLLTVLGWREIQATDWAELRPLVWIILIYLAVMASALSMFFVQYASLRLPSAKVMAYTYLTPSWVILWELALGHGGPKGLVLIGIGLTVVALGLLLKNEH